MTVTLFRSVSMSAGFLVLFLYLWFSRRHRVGKTLTNARNIALVVS